MTQRQLRRSLIELLDTAAGTTLKLLIEPAHRAETTLILTVRDGLRMIEDIGSEQLGILLDTGHAHLNGEDLAETVRSLKGVPLHIHMDDNTGEGDSHLIPGDGAIGFAPFAAALREIGYRGFVSAELGFQYTLEPDTAVQRTHAALTRVFA